jgi:hypothetical protein
MTKDYELEVRAVHALVGNVDQEYRVAAFQAILLHRLLRSDSEPKAVMGEAIQKRALGGPSVDSVRVSMSDNELDAAEFSELFRAPKLLLEKSLVVLKIARDRFRIDGMSPGDVAKILTLEFRVPRVHEPNVRAELRGATAFVSRVTAAHGYKYLLMAGGERHLAETLGRLREKKN